MNLLFKDGKFIAEIMAPAWKAEDGMYYCHVPTSAWWTKKEGHWARITPEDVPKEYLAYVLLLS